MNVPFVVTVPLSDINLILTTWLGLGTSHLVLRTPLSLSTISFLEVRSAVSLPDANAVSQNLTRKKGKDITEFRSSDVKSWHESESSEYFSVSEPETHLTQWSRTLQSETISVFFSSNCDFLAPQTAVKSERIALHRWLMCRTSITARKRSRIL